jgi:hypothetical protein
MPILPFIRYIGTAMIKLYLFFRPGSIFQMTMNLASHD